jgi:hypothetical protein
MSTNPPDPMSKVRAWLAEIERRAGNFERLAVRSDGYDTFVASEAGRLRSNVANLRFAIEELARAGNGNSGMPLSDLLVRNG